MIYLKKMLLKYHLRKEVFYTRKGKKNKISESRDFEL